MKVRHADLLDIDEIMKIITDSVKIMNENNNFQWDNTYPTREIFLNDIKEKTLYVVEEDKNILGLGVMNLETPKEYNILEWNSTNTDYVIHRLAAKMNYSRKGVAEFLIIHLEKEAVKKGKKYMRVDTNEKNIKARNLFEKLDYSLIGIINLHGKNDNFVCYEKKLVV